MYRRIATSGRIATSVRAMSRSATAAYTVSAGSGSSESSLTGAGKTTAPNVPAVSPSRTVLPPVSPSSRTFLPPLSPWASRLPSGRLLDAIDRSTAAKKIKRLRVDLLAVGIRLVSAVVITTTKFNGIIRCILYGKRARDPSITVVALLRDSLIGMAAIVSFLVNAASQKIRKNCNIILMNTWKGIMWYFRVAAILYLLTFVPIVNAYIPFIPPWI